MKTIIVARDLTAGYGDRRVLRGLDFEIEAGQIAVVLGPGGAGKSTLLRALAQPENDQYFWIGGQLEVRTSSPGVMTQKPRFEGRVAELLAGVNLNQIWHFAPEVVRLLRSYFPVNHRALPPPIWRLVELTALLGTSCPLLLLDEPTAEMDASIENWVKSQLRELRGRRTVVLITRNLGLAREAGDFILLLLDGEIGEATEVREFFEAAPNSRVGHFVKMGA